MDPKGVYIMIRSSTSLLRASLCTALLASVSAPALASTAADTQAPAETAAAAEDAMGTIVVTATKRETNLQETPISMAVMSTEALKDRHVASLYDLADGAVPSLRIATFEARQSALTIGIRGIVPLDATSPPVNKASASMSTASIWAGSMA